MTRYIALLRGINISGKNKISMPELKTALGEKGFADVESGFSILPSPYRHHTSRWRLILLPVRME
jgi:hypothetical protein